VRHPNFKAQNPLMRILQSMQGEEVQADEIGVAVMRRQDATVVSNNHMINGLLYKMSVSAPSFFKRNEECSRCCENNYRKIKKTLARVPD